MQTKTVNKDKSAALLPQTHPAALPLARIAAAGICAFLLTDVRIGGASSPFGVSLAASLGVSGGAAAVTGGILGAAINGTLWNNAGELAASVLSAAAVYAFGKKSTRNMRALLSGICYFICCAAALAGSEDAGALMFFAVFLRAVICAGGTFCIYETVQALRNGFFESGATTLRPAAAGLVYMLGIAALCGKHIWLINIGRTAAGFVTAAAARIWGKKGGAAAGVLSASAFILAAPSLGRSGAMLAFAGLAAGMYRRNGKYSVNIAFICAAFGMTAAAGMPSGTPEFIIDTGLAAALYCLVPERLYLPYINRIFAGEEKELVRTDKLSFAASVLEEVGDDAQTAAKLLEGCKENTAAKPVDYVKSSVCSAVCSQGRCSAVCGGLPEGAQAGCFEAAQSIAQKKGSITEKELPAGFEGCTKKALLADSFSRAEGIRRLSERKAAYVRRFLESSTEQLYASCYTLRGFSEESETGKRADPALSRAVCRILCDGGFSVRSAQVSIDPEGIPFTEAYIEASEDFSEVYLSDVTERISLLLGVSLAKPAVFEAGDLIRIRWRRQARYIADCHIASLAAEGPVCGDSSAGFEDGLGNFVIILSDGMGRGAKAASRSSLAVNMLKRMILGGTGRINAVKTLNVIMSAVSPEEVFTTADILTVNLYTGECRLIKMGAAPTAVKTVEEGNAVIRVFSDCSVPLGIIGRVNVLEELFCLDENSRVIMTTDGIEITGGKTAALLENDSLTCEQIADRLIAPEEVSETEKSDDKTAAVLRLYRT